MEKGHKKGYSTFEMVHEDILFLSKKYRLEGKKHFLMGHSMGGGLVLQFGLAYPTEFDGIIASGPMIRPGSSTTPNMVEKFGLTHLPKLWGSLVIPNYLDTSNLSRDPKVIEAYKSTPLNHPMAG